MSVKKVYNPWEDFPTWNRIIRSFYKAARGKYDRPEVISFYNFLETNCRQICTDLNNKKYRWGNYRKFYIIDPKLRLIESAPFRDRIVHQAMHEVLEPIFEKTFYKHSYACRKGKGNHNAMKTLSNWIDRNPQKYYLQMDVTKFFQSIDRKILFELIKRKVGDVKMLDLIGSLLHSSPKAVGIPIGNLTSQLFANVYMNYLDQFITRKLKISQYVRYMDDLVLLGDSYKTVSRLRRDIDFFGMNNMKLSFSANKVHIGQVKNGLTFVGFRISPNNIRIKGKTIRNFRKRLKVSIPLDLKIKRLMSYLGHIGYVSSYNVLKKDLVKHVYKKEIAFDFKANNI